MIPECDWCRRLRQWVITGSGRFGGMSLACDDHLIKAIDETLAKGRAEVRRWDHEAAIRGQHQGGASLVTRHAGDPHGNPDDCDHCGGPCSGGAS